MNSIPASALSSVIPGVLGAGGNPLSLNAVFLTSDDSIPIGTVQPFGNLAAVGNWFGFQSDEYLRASRYFAGFIGCTQLPGTLYFAQFNTSAVAAYLRGGTVSGLTLSALQALSGSLTLAIDGQAQTSANISLAGATSFSNAAALITTGINNASGRFLGHASQAASGNVLVVSAVTSGLLLPGNVISGTNVDAGLTIVSQTSGPTGGAGNYTVSTTTGFAATDISSAGIGTCTYDAQLAAFVITAPGTGVDSTISFATNTLSAGVKLTQATGAVLSQGAAIAVPAALMTAITATVQNWATFMTVDEVADNVKLAFAAWVQTTTDRYAYAGQDSNVLALQADQSTTFGAIVNAAEDDGVIPIYDTTGGDLAAFACGIAASIDFNETNGRTTWAYRSQAGLATQITDLTQSENLVGNGYNFYGAYATANQQFSLFQNGQISGVWEWIDAYINQIYFNSQFQLAAVNLMATLKALPYNTRGYNLMRAAFLDPINQGLNFGAFVPGVPLSAAQAQEINNATGDSSAATTLQNTGYYLQIKPASPQVRAARGSPPSAFYYTDGGSIQKIDLSSIDVQ